MKLHHHWESTVVQTYLQESSLTVTNYGYNLRLTPMTPSLDSQLPGMDH